MNISIIAAIGKNHEIGYQNKLLWHIPDDLKNFKRITLNHHILCGRKTFLSIGRVLPHRPMLILSQKKDFEAPGTSIVKNIDEAILKAKAAGEKELFVIGGGHVYEQLLPFASKIYLSEVNWEGKADTYFPKFELSKWKVIEEKTYPSKNSSPNWVFKVLLRIQSKESLA